MQTNPAMELVVAGAQWLPFDQHVTTESDTRR